MPTCPSPLLIPYFQAHELPLFSTAIYKVSKLPCPFAFWSSPLFLSCSAPGRHTINTTYQCRWFPACVTCPFFLMGTLLQDAAYPGEIHPARILTLLLIQTSKNHFKTVVSCTENFKTMAFWKLNCRKIFEQEIYLTQKVSLCHC